VRAPLSHTHHFLLLLLLLFSTGLFAQSPPRRAIVFGGGCEEGANRFAPIMSEQIRGLRSLKAVSQTQGGLTIKVAADFFRQTRPEPNVKAQQMHSFLADRSRIPAYELDPGSVPSVAELESFWLKTQDLAQKAVKPRLSRLTSLSEREKWVNSSTPPEAFRNCSDFRLSK
jgi:hypothetical protein